MDREASVALDPDPLAAREAREFVTTTVCRWGLSRRADAVPLLNTAALLTSELVTNVVLHARTHLGLSVHMTDEQLTVKVHDDDPHPPVPRGGRLDLLADIDALIERAADDPASDERTPRAAVGPAGAIGAGRGLLLVDSLADAWGVEEDRTGKAVWFRLSVA
ncbi:MAG TPA: ATP-binding protein [Mycobacteriales bacterium]|nr:ATP-binding protein [Mycobacteriales bacterium]